MSASRDALRALVGRAVDAIAAGEELGIFAAEDAAESAASAGTVASTAQSIARVPMTTMVSGAQIELTPEQEQIVNSLYPSIIAEVQQIASGLAA